MALPGALQPGPVLAALAVLLREAEALLGRPRQGLFSEALHLDCQALSGLPGIHLKGLAVVALLITHLPVPVLTALCISQGHRLGTGQAS